MAHKDDSSTGGFQVSPHSFSKYRTATSLSYTFDTGQKNLDELRSIVPDIQFNIILLSSLYFPKFSLAPLNPM